jgi:predicted metal-dependent peptidase
MAGRAGKDSKGRSEDKRRARMRERIYQAAQALTWSVFGRLLDHVAVHICDGSANEAVPQFGCVDSANGVVFLNPNVPGQSERTMEEWQYILAHQLGHLALNHAERGQALERVPWNIASCSAVDDLLRKLRLGTPPADYNGDYGFASQNEEEIYEQIVTDPRLAPPLVTFAGHGRHDMVSTQYKVTNYQRKSYGARPSYEVLFAEGIRWAVHRAVETAADIQTGERPNRWQPLEQARQWVMNHMPLLGPLAAQIRVIADAELCDRMDIGIAAVNEFLGEIYFRPDRGLTPPEILFVYVHELLHVALLHGTRLQGRNPEIWNFACDFVINGWLIEMGIGQAPRMGLLYDPRLQNRSSEEVYDLLAADRKQCRGLRGLRGKLGDILYGSGALAIRRDDMTTMDDIVRRCMAAGLACQEIGRGFAPLGLLEEIKSLFTPPVPWDVDLARWMDAHVPLLRDPLRTYARASRRQSSTPDIPRPARYIPQEWKDACTFGVVMDTSGSMDRVTLGRALGAIASYSEARDVPAVRLVMCDASPYDRGMVAPTELRGIFPVVGRGGTVLQPALGYLLSRPDFPRSAPIMIITDGWCEEELLVPRDHCFVLPRKTYAEGAMPLRTSAPVFRVLK